MEEKTEKITKYNDKRFTINKEINEDMTEVAVRKKKPYVAPKCEVISLMEDSALLAGSNKFGVESPIDVEKWPDGQKTDTDGSSEKIGEDEWPDWAN